MKTLILSTVILCSSTIFAANTCLEDPLQALKEINSRPQKHSLKTNDGFSGFEYTNHLFNLFGLNNHIQGIEIFEDSVYITGGDFKTQRGSLFYGAGELEGFYRIDYPQSKDLWHAGSLSRVDHYLAIPFEKLKGDRYTELRFFDIKDPSKPTELPFKILEPTFASGSVDFVEEEDSLFLYSFSGKEVMVYRSDSKQLADLKEVARLPLKVFKGSTTQVLKSCEGDLFYVVFENKAFMSFLGGDRNRISVYHADDKYEEGIKKVLEKRFRCRKYCNFRAGASLYQEGGKLKLISVEMYRDRRKKRIKYAIFK